MIDRWVLGAVVLGLAVGLSRRARAGGPVGPVVGDLERNWGSTPPELRELLLRVEDASRIPGAARFLAVASWRESKWHPEAHNDSNTEVTASTDAYAARSAKQPPLAYGLAAADFGSGGLFGLLGEERHAGRIARMKSTGHIGTANNFQHGRVIAHAPCTEALAEVAV